MAKLKRDDLIKAPIVGAVVAVFTFFVLYSIVGLSDMSGDVAGIDMGLFISLVMAAIVGAVLFGELLAQALEAK
jgi:hypothetical protein